MRLKYRRDISISVAVFFLKLVGFWYSACPAEKWLRNATTVYSAIALVFCMWAQIRDIYFSWGNFSDCAYIACMILVVVIDLIKLFVLVVHKKTFLRLIVYMQKHFWHFDYDDYETLIVADIKHMCVYFVCVFSFFCQSTDFLYTVRPIISNMGKNETERTLIFNMWLDLPLSTSPYFEITYVIQALALYHLSVCYICFDNILCIMCLHVAGQFRILQYRFFNTPSGQNEGKFDEDPVIDSSNCYATLKDCIRQHQALIQFCVTLDEIFKVFIFGQVLMFSTLISFLGYQVFLADLNPEWRSFFISFLMANISQLWIFTYSCDYLTRESLNVAPAVFHGPWIHLPMDKFGKMMRKDLQLVLIRSRRACCLSACGFFPISLETYTKIMSTSVSYFTILKQRTVDAAVS
ncbi:odorant receptor Or2-like [Xylocopa sonorina]|uniref:odorant receptor Or2-like n=1 Tax=Xylocopa sonorina TaxID=1818115 RepID=UPI00403AEC3C